MIRKGGIMKRSGVMKIRWRDKEEWSDEMMLDKVVIRELGVGMRRK